MHVRTLIALLMLAGCGNKPPAQPETVASGTTPNAAPTKVRLTPTDVTVIWPLPRDATQRDSMLAATSMGAHGELLPETLYDCPVLDERDFEVTDPKVDRTRLRVVAMRFEPCRNSFGPPT